MGRKRDYAAEYAKRLARGRERGFSKSISRGHPRKAIGEVSIKRARDMLLPGPVSLIRRRTETRHGYRPSYTDIRRRLTSLNLKFLAGALKGKRGRVPTAWIRPRTGDAYMDDDETRDNFIEALTNWGFNTREAYTLWFSP
jgi:hypothetical protein